MAKLGGLPRWCLIVTDVTDMPGAPTMKRTSLGRGEQVYRILSGEYRFCIRIGLQHCTKQHFGVGVRGRAIDVFGGAHLT
jgi:hypothetical protein